MEIFRMIFEKLSQPIFGLGSVKFSVLSLIKVAIALICVQFIASSLSMKVSQRLRARGDITDYSAQLISYWVKVGLWAIGLFIIADIVGIKLVSLGVFAGAVGLGIGFGLQTVINNLVSGVLIFTDRTVRIGDVITIAGETGKVLHIGARATVIETSQGLTIAIPNTQFVNFSVTNWTASGQKIRSQISVTVGSVNDPKAVEVLLLQVAQAHPKVLQTPSPQVLLTKIGETLSFELFFWTGQPIDVVKQVQSDLNYAIYKALAEQSIPIVTIQVSI